MVDEEINIVYLLYYYNCIIINNILERGVMEFNSLFRK